MVRTLLRLAPVAAILLAGCAASENYPTLSRRPAERISGRAPTVAAATTPAALPSPSADLTVRLGQLVDEARAAHGRFTGEQARTERLVSAAAGAAVASENWAVASVALASLESARSDAMIALAELDQAHITATVAAAEAGGTANRDAAAAARDQVVSLVTEEDETLARLRGRLRS